MSISEFLSAGKMRKSANSFSDFFSNQDVGEESY
jgi:hypothetical protein